MIKVSRCCKFI